MDDYRPLHRPILGSLLPVVLLLAAAAPRVSASCGDYVQVLPADHAGLVRSATDLGTPAEPRIPTPCSGPGCRRVPPAPAPQSPPAPTTTSSPHDAMLTAAAAEEPPVRSWPPAEPSTSPRHAVASVFHPPRV